MSHEALPISPSRFAEALKDLPISSIHLKVLEIRNSIAHLDYSNEQLKPFGDGTEEGILEPDQDCADAIKENEAVITRMQERINLLKAEVERRGMSWTELQSTEEIGEQAEKTGEEVDGLTNGDVEAREENGGRSQAWSDNTSSRTGGRLDDEALRRATEDRMREEDGAGGMHL